MDENSGDMERERERENEILGEKSTEAINKKAKF